MSTKSKSTLTETPNKSTPATPRISKVSRGVTKSGDDSPSPLQNSRFSVDKSPRSVTSKPSVERRSPKLSIPPDKKPTRIVKPSELQAELNVAQEDLRKANEKLALFEKEKTQALEEVKEAHKLAEEANDKLREALVAQKRAEEDSEIEKFRAVEMEQVGIDVAQKKEEEWQKELEAVRNQHALDVTALLSATHELQRVKQELAMTCDAKNQALSHAEDATNIAEVHAEKVEILSSEIVRLKSLLDSKNSTNETEADEKNKLVEDLKLEIETLRKELENVEILSTELVRVKSLLDSKNSSNETEASEKNKLVEDLKLETEALKKELEEAKSYETKLVEKESILEQLNVDLEASKMAESYAHNLMEEWKKKVEELEVQAEEARHLERSASASLESVMKQLEGSNNLLHDAESEIASLKEKMGLLEITIAKQKGDLEDSEHRARMAKEEACEMAKNVESLKSELETFKKEKIQALENEKLTADSVQTLLEEKNKLINELESSREEEEKSKKAMESLASALHEVSSEAREAKERLLSSETEHEHYKTQIEDLKLVVKATNEKFESMLDEAKGEHDVLTNSVKQSKDEHQKLKAEWEETELHLMNCVKSSEEENSIMEKEINRLVNLLKEAEEEASAKKEEEAHLENSLKEAESEVTYFKEVLSEAKGESMNLKECLMDKENEVQHIIQENEELRSREAASLKKVEELSKLLEGALAKNEAEENGDRSDKEKDYDMLPKLVSEQNGGGRVEKPTVELPPYESEQPVEEKLKDDNITSCDEAVLAFTAVEISNGKLNEFENKENGDDDSVECQSEQPVEEKLKDDNITSRDENVQAFTAVEISNGKLNEFENKENGGDHSVECETEQPVQEKPKDVDIISRDEAVQASATIEISNGKLNEFENKENGDNHSAESELIETMIETKVFSPERQAEQQQEESESKADGGESYDQINALSSAENLENGGTSPTKQQSLKKKKPLFHKFGSLLKKKSTSNQK